MIRFRFVHVTVALWLYWGIVPLTESCADTEIVVRLDRGEDIGQNFGSLFEGVTQDGAFIVGAGFSGLYNTYHRDDRHVVHFYIRPTRELRPLQAEPLPRPNDLAGTYLFNFDGDVFASVKFDSDAKALPTKVRVWDESNSSWDSSLSNGWVNTRVGNNLVSFDRSRVLVNGAVLLEAPTEGGYLGFYYAQGHLFFYHILKLGKAGYRNYTNDSEGYSKLYACPWKVGEGKVDLRKAVIMTVPIVGEFPYAYGQLGDQVLSCSNIGGAYAFRNGKWRTVVEGELESSYQVYTMLTYYDQLLMGQYPTGELFSFDGEQVNRLKGWPPHMEGVRGSSREAQSLAIYGGELYVGVWPWGEVWKYHNDLKTWSLAKRIFSHPDLTDETTHPYERECGALGVVLNQWGQRVTSMVSLRDGLLISSSAKWPCKWEPKFDFIAHGAWKEYGTVTRVVAPGHLSAFVHWTGKTTELRFVLKGAEMRIEQKGMLLGSAQLSGAVKNAPASADDLGGISWGRGAYGEFSGVSLDGLVSH